MIPHAQRRGPVITCAKNRRSSMIRRALISIAAFSWISSPVATFAEEDGGSQSVFAFGAGNRALAMGGAFVGVADDASAAIWNPAGLGLLQMSELQVSHASVGDVDMNEQYAAIAIPSWKWGGASATFRRFAVGGIEGRDDRNAIIPGEISDHQSEIKLSYGRAIGDAWSAGGSFNIRRQSLAGFSATGVGVDLGAIVRPGAFFDRENTWVNRVRAGVAILNVIEPTLRLSQDEITDPILFRTGASYRHDWSDQVSLLTALDFEKSSKTEAMMRLGLESTLLETLSLRAGWNDAGWAAGAGVHWKGASVDYVLEENEIETVHRFGLSYGFGLSIEESRQASLREEEERFRARLAESFENRQNERITELLRSATTHLETKNYEEALQILAAILALDPGHEEARALQIECFKREGTELEQAQDYANASILYRRALAIDPEDAGALAGHDRCRAELARSEARSEHIRELFDASLDAFSTGNLRKAEDQLLAILEVAPDDEEAKTLLRRTRVAIDARTRDLLEQANRVLNAGLASEAEALADEVLALNPRANGLRDLLQRIRFYELALHEKEQEAERAQTEEAKKVDESATAPAPTVAIAPKPAALSKKKQKDLADLYKRGMTAMEEGRLDDALRYWELVWLGNPEYEGVADHLKREYLLRGLESFSRGSLDEAILLWVKALNVDPKDEKTIRYLARAREQLSRSREILGEKP
jgi:tetratricopeptide (TPR) repeat protein